MSDNLGELVVPSYRETLMPIDSPQSSYPAYITSVGWLGYSDGKILQLTKDAVAKGFKQFKMKVGSDLESDLRRGKLIRSIIDDPRWFSKDSDHPDPNGPELKGKNAGPTGAVLMIDANQVWDVNEAIEYTKGLVELKPWCVYEELKLLMTRPS